MPILSQPPSITARTDFLNASGSATVWVFGVENWRVAVAVGKRIGDRALGQPGHLGEHFARGVGIEVGVLAFAERLVDAEHLEQVEFLVTDV